MADTALHMDWDGRLPPLPAEGPLLPPVPHRDFDGEHVELYEEITLSPLLDVDIQDFEAQEVSTYFA